MQPVETTRRLGARQLLAWFLVGVVMALFLQWLQVRTVGGDWTALVNIGETSTLRPLIEAELGPVTTVKAAGHDGQFTYLIAVDPLSRKQTSDLFGDGAYRYRRILLPALGGGFGLLSGKAILVGLIAWSVFGMGLATAAIADIGSGLGTRPWVVAGVLANPGLWLSVQILTSDALALGLALGGVAFWRRGHRSWGVVALALAVLAKDQYLLVAISLAGWEWFRLHRRDAGILVAGAAGPLVIWSVWLTSIMGQGFTPRGNLSFPLVGIIEAAPGWAENGAVNLTFSLITTGSLLFAAGILYFVRSAFLRWLIWPWVALALISSEWVWNLGNNALRVFAPLIVFAVLAIAVPRPRPETPSGTSDGRLS